jgi:lysophospholipase L1-like esterase
MTSTMKWIPALLCLIVTALAEAVTKPAAPTREGSGSDAITFTAPPPGFHLRYTIDGSAPGAKSGPYLAPIHLPAGYKLRVIAVSDDRKQLSDELVVEGAAPAGEKLSSSVVPCTQDRDFPVYDWAKRHASVTSLVKDRKSALIFIGDSITQMFGGEPHDRPQPGKDVWEKYYGARNAANLGFGYDYTENTLWRLQHGELDGAAAKAVVLNIGTNNAGKNTASEIVAGVKASLAEIRRSQPNAKVLLLGIYPRGAKPDATREKLAAVNRELAQLDGKNGVYFLDLTEKLLQPDGTILRETMGDFLHPTARGYEIIAEAIEPTLRRLLEEK